MRRSCIASLIAAGAISLALSGSTATAVAASPRAASSIGTHLSELEGSDTVAGDYFGYSVATSGTSAVVGAPGYGGHAGRAYVFTKTGAGWEQAAELKGSDTAAGDYFGYSVAISGMTAIVGAPGLARAYVFTKRGAGWKQAAELKGSDTVAGDGFGDSVAISGTSAVAGADGHAKAAGRAYVFTKTGAGWAQAAELKGSDTVAGDLFGGSVTTSGTSAVVGASGHAGHAGRAYVFAKTGAGWAQAAELKASDTAAGDYFGDSVATSGTSAVVGASGYARDAGRAYVFAKTGAGWKQVAELKGSDTVAGDYFGDSLAMSGTTIVVGAPVFAKEAGQAYLFTNTASGWKQAAELKGSGTVAGDGFGGSVAISGTSAVAGADDHAKAAGRAYVFEA
ncbi:MAG: FG-GAP repeat protein [Acidimicrobiales bacterium]|jgi:hypothetical protein